jgi:hypothetical protein
MHSGGIDDIKSKLEFEYGGSDAEKRKILKKINNNFFIILSVTRRM